MIQTDLSNEPSRNFIQTFRRLLNRVQSSWKTIVVLVPFVWLLIFFLAPFFIVAKISLAELVIASPPYSKMIEWLDGGIITIRLVFDNFIYIFEDPLYARTYLNSIKIASISTLSCLLIGYPVAYGIVRSSRTIKPLLLFAIILLFGRLSF